MTTKAEKELKPGMPPGVFYRDYIQDNPVFETMPDDCRKFIDINVRAVYEEALTIRGDEWSAVEAAVRRVLNRNGLDGESW